MVSEEELLAYMLPRGILQPSIDRHRSKFLRWRTFLATNRVHSLDPLVQNKLMNLLIQQASPIADSATKHRLRNESGIRPPKP